MNYVDKELEQVKYLLSLSEDNLLDLISENNSDSIKYTFIPLKSVGNVGNIAYGAYNGIGLLPYFFVHNCLTLLKSKHQRVKEWCYNKYSPFKKTICHIPFVKQFSNSQILEAEVVIEIAKELAEKSGDAMKFTIIVAAYIVKAGLQNFCNSEWR